MLEAVQVTNSEHYVNIFLVKEKSEFVELRSSLDHFLIFTSVLWGGLFDVHFVRNYQREEHPGSQI